MNNRLSKVRDAVLWAASFLTERGIENSRLEAELLMAKAMGAGRATVLANFRDVLPGAVKEQFLQLVRRRGEHYPLQYLTGTQNFMSLDFAAKEGVLIPRGDTEVLVETLVNLNMSFENILDVGTGSGIIAISLARYIPKCQVTAIDISPGALELAAQNAAALGVAEKISFIQADVFNWSPGTQYDLIVSNPPYISRREMETLPPEVQFEPKEALMGGEEGLDFYFRLAELAAGSLKVEGVLAVEIGWQQAVSVKEIFRQACLRDITVVSDYGGRDRVVICRK